MNCKLNDLVIVIKSSQGNEGKIGKIISFAGESPIFDGKIWGRKLGPCWIVEFPRPITTARKADHSLKTYRKIVPMPDDWLRPVSGIPDVVEVEEVLYEN